MIYIGYYSIAIITLSSINFIAIIMYNLFLTIYNITNLFYGMPRL